MNVVTTQESSLVCFDSADATRVSAEYGNGSFTCQMKNSNRAGTHAVKVVPVKIMIPNVFPNISADMNEVYIRHPQNDPNENVRDIKLVPGFYTVTRLVDVLDRFSGSNLNITFDAFNMKVRIQNVTTIAIDIVLSLTLARMLGFAENQFVANNANQTVIMKTSFFNRTVVASNIPFMGTTPLVHVLARKAATQNLLSSNSTEYSVLATVPMNGAAFGEYALYMAPDIFVDDIDFRTPRNLSDVDFEVVDHMFRPLIIDRRFPVLIQLKVFHVDTQK